jgi:hypothetical protein
MYGEDAHLDAAYESRFGQDEIDGHFEGISSALTDLPTATECAEWCSDPKSGLDPNRCYNCCHEHITEGGCQQDKDGKYCSMVGKTGES